MSTPKPAPPTTSKGFNLSGFDPAAILSGFSQVFVANGSQRLLLSKDSQQSDAGINFKKQINVGGTHTVAAPAANSNAPKPGGGAFFTKYKTPLIIGGAAVAGVAILGGVFLLTR